MQRKTLNNNLIKVNVYYTFLVDYLNLTIENSIKTMFFNLFCQKIKNILTLKRFHFMIIYVNDYYKLKINKGDVFYEKQSKMEWCISSSTYPI